MLKERRKLVLVPRETPLSEIHLPRTCSRSPGWGRASCRPCAAFYNGHPATLDDVVDHIVARILETSSICPAPAPKRWTGLREARQGRAAREVRETGAAASATAGLGPVFEPVA